MQLTGNSSCGVDLTSSPERSQEISTPPILSLEPPPPRAAPPPRPPRDMEVGYVESSIAVVVRGLKVVRKEMEREDCFEEQHAHIPDQKPGLNRESGRGGGGKPEVKFERLWGRKVNVQSDVDRQFGGVPHRPARRLRAPPFTPPTYHLAACHSITTLQITIPEFLREQKECCRLLHCKRIPFRAYSTQLNLILGTYPKVCLLFY